MALCPWRPGRSLPAFHKWRRGNRQRRHHHILLCCALRPPHHVHRQIWEGLQRRGPFSLPVPDSRNHLPSYRFLYRDHHPRQHKKRHSPNSLRGNRILWHCLYSSGCGSEICPANQGHIGPFPGKRLVCGGRRNNIGRNHDSKGASRLSDPIHFCGDCPASGEEEESMTYVFPIPPSSGRANR